MTCERLWLDLSFIFVFEAHVYFEAITLGIRAAQARSRRAIQTEASAGIYCAKYQANWLRVKA